MSGFWGLDRRVFQRICASCTMLEHKGKNEGILLHFQVTTIQTMFPDPSKYMPSQPAMQKHYHYLAST